MKKSEKTEMSREKIISAAWKAFGVKGYHGTSLNTICNDNEISKGLLYHNFKNKDDLYLICLQNCFEGITEFLKNQNEIDDLKSYMQVRHDFFKNHPLYSYLFFEATLHPPKHLINEIKEVKKEFDQYNIEYYRKIIANLTLRDGVSEQEALEYYMMVQSMYNGLFESGFFETTDFPSLIDTHERKLTKVIDFMLYGIVKETLIK